MNISFRTCLTSHFSRRVFHGVLTATLKHVRGHRSCASSKATNQAITLVVNLVSKTYVARLSKERSERAVGSEVSL